MTGGFLQHAVQSADSFIEAHWYTCAPSTNIYAFRNLESRIPLPPLSEQRRIAEVLDRAEALRAKRRAALAQLDSLTQAIFLDLFGDPVDATNPKGWRIAECQLLKRCQGGRR